jgi:hypothetical protein
MAERGESARETRRDVPSSEAAGAAGRGRAGASGRPPLQGRLALGLTRLGALLGVIGLAIAAAAIMVSQDVAGWIVGLALGVGVELLTMLVLFSRRFT